MVTVYLDTSDFSYFADIKMRKGTPENKKILDELLELKSQEKVEFRYSMVHISELLKSSSKYTEENFARGKVMEELCGDKTLISINDLWIQEIINAAKNKFHDQSLSTNNGFHKSDSGLWYPNMVFKNQGDKIINLLKDILKNETSTPRAERRKIQAQFKKSGKKAFYKNAIDHNLVSNELYREAIGKFLRGEIREKEIISYFIKKYTLPSNILVKTDKRDKFEEIFAGPLIKMGNEFMDRVNSFRTEMSQYDPKLLRQKAKKSQILKEIKPLNLIRLGKALFEYDEKNQNLFKSSSVKFSDFKEIIDQEKFELMPSMYAVFRYNKSYIKIHILTDRTPKLSDSGDTFHFLYAPYVDIFRADKFTKQIAEDLKSSINFNLVEKLKELPSAIKKLIK